VDAVTRAIDSLEGVEGLQVNLTEKQVIVVGSTRPSLLLEALKSTGLTTIVRGQGSTAHLGAAVCIFEHFPEYQKGWAQYINRGLARLIQVDDKMCLLDLSLHDVAPGQYHVVLHESGDISRGVESTGSAVETLGTVQVDKDGTGTMLSELSVKIWDMIGRSIVVDKVSPATENGICGVVARSAGVFENTKTVCACSGKTLWSESTSNL
jgi:copper chaperone for superoxide dismutase